MILYTQMKAQCIRYVATDSHVDRFSSIFENQLQSWSTDFGFLPPSSPISETAEASGVILQLRHTCVSHSAMTQQIEKQAKENGKIPHMSWKTKMWLPKKSKISFHRVCEWVTKSEPLTILSPLVRIFVISKRTAASRSTKIVLEDFIQMSYEGLAFT